MENKRTESYSSVGELNRQGKVVKTVCYLRGERPTRSRIPVRLPATLVAKTTSRSLRAIALEGVTSRLPGGACRRKTDTLLNNM